jgi:Tol biopolymer transport system component
MPELGWVDRSGNPRGWIGTAGDSMPALSHDGMRVAISRYEASSGVRNLWMLDLGHGGVASRITFRTAWDTCPVWSPDDTKIVFARGSPRDAQLIEISPNGTTPENLVPLDQKGCPLDWSRDGRYLLFSAPTTNGGAGTLWILPVDHHAQPTELDGIELVGPRGSSGAISPNGHWLAYERVAAGHREIYVRAFPNGNGAGVAVSSEGGIEPQWRGDGGELFFLGADDRLMAAPVSTEGAFRAGTPTALFLTELDPVGLPIVGRNQYMVTPDGQRFLINQARRDAPPASVIVITNWPATLKR